MLVLVALANVQHGVKIRGLYRYYAVSIRRVPYRAYPASAFRGFKLLQNKPSCIGEYLITSKSSVRLVVGHEYSPCNGKARGGEGQERLDVDKSTISDLHVKVNSIINILILDIL